MLEHIKIKLKASFFHLCLSAIIIIILTSLIIYFWFPWNYLGITNFKSIMLLILCIDVILGPLITLFIYKPNKKSLRFDLSMIASIQVLALAYGLNALYETHPLYITYNHGAFNLVQANEVNPSKAKYKEFNLSKLSSPKLAFAKMPTDPKEQTDIIIGVDLLGEPDIDKRTEYYEPYEKHLDTILKSSLNETKIFKNENLTASSKAFLKKHGNKESFAYLPLKGVAGDAIIVLDKESSKVIATIKSNPWKFVQR